MCSVYYAIDNSRLHLRMAELSIKSLRRHNRSIPAQVFLWGAGLRAARRFEKLGAEVIVQPKCASGIPPQFLKWRSLKHVSADRALYVDSDTLFFEDPLRLFKKFAKKDFYAREEYGTRPGVGYQLLGNCVLQPQIHPKKYKAVAALLDFKRRPVFNTGVMLFNHGFAATAGSHFGKMEGLFRLFERKPTYYPAENFHISDEIISSIVFGMDLKRNSFGRIPKDISPWYCEWKAGVVPGPGVVMHSWTKYAPFFVRDFLGKAEAARLPFLIPAESGYAEY